MAGNRLNKVRVGLSTLTRKTSLRALWGTAVVATVLWMVLSGNQVPELLAGAFGALMLEFRSNRS